MGEICICGKPLIVLPAGLKGVIHSFVIISGHDAIRKALPASAGFKMLNPSPPNNCFAIIMAKAEPTAGNHHGDLGGMLNANRMPVRIALPSNVIFLRRTHKQSHSENCAEAQAISVR